VFIHFEDRPSDSAFVDRVWRSCSERSGTFHSMATCNSVMVVSRHDGRTFLTIRGPETRATIADCPADGEWVGIEFRLGTFLPLMRASDLRDRNGVTLPGSRRSFSLNGSTWEYPGFENAEAFVGRLVRQGLIVSDPCVEATLCRRPETASQRTEQRHFLRAVGLTHATVRQINRARHATQLLREGAAISRVVDEAGYFDQAHLTRSLKRFIGQTPVQIVSRTEQLSFLYKTAKAGSAIVARP
jgi:AraC-like DNA-binding protein